MKLDFVVGHVDCSPPIASFSTAEDASWFIGFVVKRRDPSGVEAGLYYIDGPEE